uniref:biotin/lipoyl-containing protein n=1 Tax=Campylobacter fetus TaxID=196 RepID=UPI000818AC08
LFAKHNTNTIRNFDALNDVKNLQYSGERIVHHGLKHEVVVTMMDLPPNCEGAHDAAFYEKCLRDILNSDIKFHSVCFKDASGTSSPEKVYQTIKMARKLLGDSVHLRLHTHETAGVSVACYLAALEAGADGIDLAASPVSGGTSQPDILTMLHAVKGKNYDLGGLDVEKILKYEDVLHGCLKDYFMPPEATQVSPLIPFSPMPGGALTANTQMMRDNNILDKFPAVIKAMREVVEKGGYGTSVTPVSQFYFQQAFNNVIFGPWKKIAEGYGKMVLGYFGKTPVAPHQDIVELASKQLELEPTNESAIDIADKDETKSLAYTKAILEKEGIDQTEENIFIAAACKEKGVAYLKGDGKVMVRKISNMPKPVLNQTATKTKSEANKYSIVVNGSKYNVEVSDGFDNFEIKSVTPVTNKPAQTTEKKDKSKIEQSSEISSSNGSNEIRATMSAGVFKILVKVGDTVGKGQTVVILEAMKMEIPVESPSAGVVSEILITQGQSVDDGQILIKL